jgi:hypothetical protein
MKPSREVTRTQTVMLSHASAESPRDEEVDAAPNRCDRPDRVYPFGENTTPRRRHSLRKQLPAYLDRVARQISHDAAEQNGAAYDHRAVRT